MDNNKTNMPNEQDLDEALEKKFQSVLEDVDYYQAAASHKRENTEPQEQTEQPEESQTEPSTEEHTEPQEQPVTDSENESTDTEDTTETETEETTPAEESDFIEDIQDESMYISGTTPEGDPILLVNDLGLTEQPIESEQEPVSEAEEPVEEIPQPPKEKPILLPNGKYKIPRERKLYYKLKREILITNRIGDVLRIFCICLLLFGISIFLMVGNRPKESAEENRMLASMPEFSWSSFWDGSYLEGVMYYYEDTVPGRSYFKQIISRLTQLQGLETEDNVQFYGTVKQVDVATPVDVATSAESTTTVAVASEEETYTTTTVPFVESDEEPVDIGDGIVLVGDRAISLYGGSFDIGKKYAETLNSYKKDLGEDVNIYSMVVPTAVSYYLPSAYSNYTASESDNIDNINKYLDDVTPVDIYSTLDIHKGEDIYARTDHHWLPLGAYYAAMTFAEDADVDFALLEDYTSTTLEGYVGSMYTFTGSAVLQDNPEDFTYYTPKAKYSTTYYDLDFSNEYEGNLLIDLENVSPVNWYLVFMGGDQKIAHVSTEVKNGRTLVIVKDSFGNALAPYLTSSFENIYVVDFRYINVNAVDFMKEVEATDVLFALNTFSATGSNCDYLEQIRTQ